MIQAKAVSFYALTGILGVAGGKMEPDIPWWVVFAGVMVLCVLLGLFATHERDSDKTDITKGDFQKLLEDSNYQVRELKSAVAKLPQVRLGDAGHTYTELPAGARMVTKADGELLLALPIRIPASAGEPAVGVSLVGGSAVLTVTKATEDE